MTSTPRLARIRKDPTERRAEIVAAAAALALSEGLECITVRRVADALSVRPGLISHYFPVTEELVAEAFGTAATAELDHLVPPERPTGTPLDHLRRFMTLTAGETYDDMSKLWLNVRHLARFRPALRSRVREQQDMWRRGLVGLIEDGVRAGQFRTDDPTAAALHILVVMDGLGVDANIDTPDVPDRIARLVRTTAEQELGLGHGVLDPTPSTQGVR